MAGAAPRERPTPPEGPPPGLNAPLTTIPGIGPKSAKNLERLGLNTLGDLLWYLPRRYIDYSQLKTINRLWYGEEVTVLATIEEMKVRPTRGGQMKLVEAVVGDGTGSLRVTWFNQPWIANQLPAGEAVALSGRIDQYLGRLTMNSPEWEPLDRQQLHTSRIVPVYSLTAGVTARWLRRVMDSVVRRLGPRLPDPLPAAIRERQALASLPDAIEQIHFPESWDRLRQAQERLAFDEMLLLQLGVMRQRQDWSTLTTQPLTVDDEWIVRFRAGLPYPLTQAQETAVADLRRDLASGRPMNRLLQGDVGSGKTVVAAAAIGIAVAAGGQAALLAPTSILADQHFQTLRGLLEPACGIPPAEVRLLIGATPESEKAEIREGLEKGAIRVVVGTHALLEGPVRFARLGLAVIDEQHRFGVEQRAALRAKGENPNLLVMTATPIPRSLALTVFGDLDLTVLDEMPPGRQPIETRILFPIERSRGYTFVEPGTRPISSTRWSRSPRRSPPRLPSRSRNGCSARSSRITASGCSTGAWAPTRKTKSWPPSARGSIRSWSRPRWSKSGSTSPMPRSCSSKAPTVSGWLSCTSSAAGSAGVSINPIACCSPTPTTLPKTNDCGRWRRRATASAWPSSTWSSAVPATSSERARPAWPICGWRG
ncbi:MAG: recG [Anaerolineales bacterium]|nr:recG [Anaerolineales bacterium]